MERFTQRARGALAGFILGDSLGVPTSGMTADEIASVCGLITGLGASGELSRTPGAPAGSTSMCTDLMLDSAELLSDACSDPDCSAPDSMAWTARPQGEFEKTAVIHPARPRERGFSTAHVAVMAVPVGIAYSLAAHGNLIHSSVSDVCDLTDETRQSREAAMIVALAVSAAVDGESAVDAIDLALAETAGANIRGRRTSEASVVARTLQAIDWAADLREVELVRHLHDIVGLSESAGEAVPAAITLVRTFAHDPYVGLCTAAQLGGEASLIGSLTGALLGAACGIDSFPEEALAQIDAAALSMTVADRLLAESGRDSAIRGVAIS